MDSSCSTTSSSSTPTLWDVFLSFRGIDTRIGFTSHLYNSLHRTGIRTFIDEPELRGGDVISLELLHAIKQSKIYIVVLSENYASSGWCLDELVEILGCWESMGRLVLPIFYNIEPSMVRHQTGKFKEAFGKHEGRVEMEIVNKWRFTLKKVSNFSGYHIRHLRTEADIINEVVDRVLLQINPMTLEVAKYPVGIDSRVADIKSLLGSSSSTINGVHWIGIHGMGGVGKTTLAKAFYNQMFGSFEGSSFLADVKDVCGEPKGLVSLQQQLIDDVLKRKNTTTINNIDGGINSIRERIRSLKVLVVLDDLDDRKQVDHLVGKFLVGSVIILTTRNEDLLDAIKVEARYKVTALGIAESRKLFTYHAFGDTKISAEFMVMSEEILGRAGGLPLAITVFGSNLFNLPEDGWRWFIDKLQRVPIDDVEKKLMISFDALKRVDPILQDVFLDIACFFVGEMKDDALIILEACYTMVNHYIGLLRKRCLITINENNQLSMHDLLRGMGRELARNGSPKKDPGKHSRLFTWEDICNVLENNKGTKAIEGMVQGYDIRSREYSFDAQTFKRMPNLRFLKLHSVNLTGSFRKTFKDLRWLRWLNCPLDCLPSDFCPEKLVILDLVGSKLNIIREKTMVMKNLKILDMSYSDKLSRTLKFSELQCLETLKFKYCRSLVEVDSSIGNLARLVTLDLSYCKGLRGLPDSMCKLRALKSLDVTDCSSLEAFPMRLGDIESLTMLYANELSISQLPDSIGHLSKLVLLSLDSNYRLQCLPDTICNLRSLEILKISDCPKLKALPVQLGNIESLLELKARGLCILNLPNSFGCLSKLVRLELSACQKVETLPDTICKLRSLKILKIIDSEQVEEMACGNSQLTNLRLPSTLKGLEAFRCRSLLRLPILSNLIQLEKLKLRGCNSLTEIEGLEKLISIRELHLEDCTSMKRLPNISNLQRLEILNLKNCSSLTEIEGLEKLISVRNIYLQGCISMKRLSNLSDLQQLETLQLTGCTSLTEIEGFEKLSVKQLNFEGCTSLSSLSNMTELKTNKPVRFGWLHLAD